MPSDRNSFIEFTGRFLRGLQICVFLKVDEEIDNCLFRVLETFIAGFPQTDFDTKLVNFFLKLVLPVILKELLSNFLISTLRLFQKLSDK